MKQYIDFLGLKKRVTLHLIPMRNAECDAEYEAEYSDSGRLIEHVITVYTKNPDRDYETLIAHELIHAKQEEEKLTETHGPFFIKYAKKMEKEFNLREIYLADIDLE